LLKELQFNAGNLKPVAKSIKCKNPEIRVTVAADNDTHTEGNPGLTKGRKAAGAVGVDLIYPDFSGLSQTGTDFNDYVVAGGVL
jgi:putative DNA primase/helicase